MATAISSSCSAMSPSTSASTIRACSSNRVRAVDPSAIVEAPGRQAVVLERELGDLRAHAAELLRDAVLAVELAVEQHVAAAGAGHLAAQRAGLAGLRVG